MSVTIESLTVQVPAVDSRELYFSSRVSNEAGFSRKILSGNFRNTCSVLNCSDVCRVQRGIQCIQFIEAIVRSMDAAQE